MTGLLLDMERSKGTSSVGSSFPTKVQVSAAPAGSMMFHAPWIASDGSDHGVSCSGTGRCTSIKTEVIFDANEGFSETQLCLDRYDVLVVVFTQPNFFRVWTSQGVASLCLSLGQMM